MSSYSRQQLEKWVGNISVPDNSEVIDVGGSQNPVNKRLKSCGIGTTFEILDLEAPHEYSPTPNILQDLNLPASFTPCCDYAFCLEVSEYWYNPLVAVKNIASLLREGGTLYISFHFVYPIHNPKEQDCLRYTEFGVKKLLALAGLEIKNITYRMPERSTVHGMYLSEGMRPSKEYTNHEAIGYLVEAIKT